MWLPEWTLLIDLWDQVIFVHLLASLQVIIKATTGSFIKVFFFRNIENYIAKRSNWNFKFNVIFILLVMIEINVQCDINPVRNVYDKI